MESENAYQIIESIGSLSRDGVLIYNQKSHEITYINESLAWIFNVSPEAIMHDPQRLVDHIIEEDFNYIMVQADLLNQHKKIEYVECRIVQGEEVKTLSCKAYKIGDDIICFVQDITKLREHENYIVDYGAKKDTLLEMISHNLSGPLQMSANILSSLERALAQSKNQVYNDHVELIRRSLDDCVKIVNDFLEDEHLTSEHIFSKITRFDALEKINVSLERLRLSYPEKQIYLKTSASHLFINNDEVKFFQAVQNLVSNSIKFTQDDGLIEIAVKEEPRKFFISVKDNGVGIPEELQSMLFEKYSAAGRPGLRGEKSLGMGLYIVKKLVTLMGGKISFASKVNEGSVFTIELPRVIPSKKGSP